MFAEFIYRPTSGQYPEKHFGKVSPNCLWVKFMDNDYEEWVGSFQQYWDGYGTFILYLDKKEKAFVVAGGQSYLIDISTRHQMNKQEISSTKSAILNDEQTIVYFSDGRGLQFVDMNGNISVLLDIYYFDNIELIEVKGNKLYARYWYYQRDAEPFLFEIDLQTKEFKDSHNDNKLGEHTNVKLKLSLFDKIAKWIKR